MTKTRASRSLVASALGVGAGAAYAAFCMIRRRRREGGLDPQLEQLETDSVDALCADERTGRCAIDVAALGSGIIELTGTVPDEDTRQHAASVLQAVGGVDTVVNRLTVEETERHLEETRRRLDEGDAALTEAGWEGNKVGMGARRQGHETDPDRPDDSVPMRIESLRTDEPAS